MRKHIIPATFFGCLALLSSLVGVTSGQALVPTGILWSSGNGRLQAANYGTGLSFNPTTGVLSYSGGGGGLTVGNAVTGGAANALLYEDGTGKLAASTSLTFDGSSLSVGNDVLAGSGQVVLGGSSLVAANNLQASGNGDLAVQVKAAGSLAVNGYTSQTNKLVKLTQQSSAAAARPAGYLDAALPTPTDASFLGRLSLFAADYTGTDREGVRVESDGTQAKLGFFGAAAAARPTGDVGAGLTSLGLLASPSYAATSLTGTISAARLPTTGLTIASYGSVLTTDVDGATVTFDLGVSNDHQVTIAGNRTLALANEPSQGTFRIYVIQDGTGSRTVTWWSGIAWNGGSTPVLSTAAGAIDTFVFVKRGTGNYLGYFTAGATYLTPTGNGSQLIGITESQIANLTTDLAAKAPLVSPTFTGIPAAPTATAGTNTTQLATTQFVTTAVAGVSGGGMTVGGAVTGGTNNAVLHEDGTGKLAASGNLTYDGTNVTLTSAAAGAGTIKISGNGYYPTITLGGTGNSYIGGYQSADYIAIGAGSYSFLFGNNIGNAKLTLGQTTASFNVITAATPTANAQQWQDATLTTQASVTKDFEVQAKGFVAAISTKTTAYTATASDSIILADATAGTFSVTLPASVAGRHYTVKKTDASANAVTVAGTIDGATNYSLAAQNKYVNVVGDGTNWQIVGNN